MLIRIINGIYGHRPKLANGKTSNYIVPITRDDLPIDVEDKEAKRLVDGCIAEYVNDKAVATASVPSENETPNGNTRNEENGTEEITEGKNAITSSEKSKFTTDMHADELRAAMNNNGLTMKSGMTKADMVNALNSIDNFPELTVQDVVDE